MKAKKQKHWGIFKSKSENYCNQERNLSMNVKKINID